MAKHAHTVDRLRPVVLSTAPAPADLPNPGFRPLGSKVVVLLDDPPEKIGSLFTPEVAQKNPLERTYQATVVAAGPGEPVRTGEVKTIGRNRMMAGVDADGHLPQDYMWKRKPMLVKRGDRVLLNRLVGSKVERAGTQFYVVDQDDIKALCEFA